MKIGKIIRQHRLELKFTQKELALRLNTSQDTISLWELGKSVPDLEAILKLTKVFNISVNELIGIKEAETETEVEITEPKKELS